MKIQKIAKHGEMLPRGYGVAWEDPARWVAVCYPVPFHRPIGWLRRWYWDFVQPPRSPEADRLKARVEELERQVREYQERDARDEAWARELIKTARHLGELQ